MDKSMLRKFSIESRELLMEMIENQLKIYKVDEDFEKNQTGDLIILKNEKTSLPPLTTEQYNRRNKLISRIKDLSENNDFEFGKKRVIEESAYTLFNRIIAIRYMEINDMLPLTKDNQSLGIRVLSSKDNTNHPEILKQNNLTNMALDFKINLDEYNKLKTENQQFNYILKKVCNKLGQIIPQIFDGKTDYIDILMPENMLSDNGFVTKVITEIPENNFKEGVEIIGWLYQYYNQTEKDRVISAKRAYKKDEIPYATQLFTPDWIVKYMVENSLGRYWVEHSDNDSIIDNWKYFIKYNIEKQYNLLTVKEVNEMRVCDLHKTQLKQLMSINPTKITFIDPCCGSGHILVYAFEVFYQIYKQEGYNKNDIPELILKNNLYGLDIDDRAGQLSVLSVLLKAREYDKNIFNKDIIKNLNIMSIQESNTIRNSILENILDEKQKENAKYLIDNFKNAKEIGSLLILENKDYTELKKTIENDDSIFGVEIKNKILPLIKIANILSNKYDIVVTNPPYLNSSFMSVNLKKYIGNNYTNVKSDIFSSFIIKNYNLGKENAYIAFMTPYVWMFISSYEDLRDFVIENTNIKSFIQMEYSALEEATVPICSFVLNKNNRTKRDGIFIDLGEFTGGMKKQEEYYLKSLTENTEYIYIRNTELFKNMSGKQLAFQNNEKIFNIFKNEKKLSEFAVPKCGLKTGITKKYVKNWFEVNFNDIGFNIKNRKESIKSNKKWFPASSGGEYRKWYGNQNDVVWWFNDGYEIRNLYNPNGKLKSRPQNMQYYFKEGITWSAVTSKKLSLRVSERGNIITGAGYGLFNEKISLFTIMGILNSKIVERLVKSLSQTLNFEVGVLEQIPIILFDNKKVEEIVNYNIKLSKDDWDSFETSWDFNTHPLIKYTSASEYGDNSEKCNYKIEESYKKWEDNCNEKFKILKQNEEKLNRIFIDIYGLQDELTPEVEDKDITIRKADKVREIKSLISYAVGCMFGRYSLDEDGLVYAGGEFDINKYKLFKADEDNIIPITDEPYFTDDILGKFKKFVEVAFGKETLKENLDFIAETLGKKSSEKSEDTIRRYFVNDFYKDHIKMYQKKPIYWLFDSGKKNGFKCLIYMHRYGENLVAKMRLDYLYKIQKIYELRLNEINSDLNNISDLSVYDIKKLEKEQENLQAKLNEIKIYNDKLSTIGDKKIKIDLDDGVTENYKKFTYVDPITNKESSILGEEKNIIPKKK